MNTFVISYDLHRARNYEPLWSALRKSGAVRILESLWLLETSASISQVSISLHGLVDHDDSFVVIELKKGSQWASVGGQPLGVQWLNSKIRHYPIAA